jgi:hypothetical protein
MQFSRRLWVAAACTVAVLVAAPAVHAQGNKVLPSDTELVMTINIQQILKSEVLKTEQSKIIVELAKAKIQEQLDDKGVGKYLKKAGFDVFKDLGSVTVAIPGGRNPEEAFILLEGKFDSEKIEAAVMDASKEAGGDVKVKSLKIANTSAFEVTPKDEKTMYVGVLNEKTMIACATKADFTEAVARAGGTKAATFKAPAFNKLLETVNTKQSISFAATAKVMAKLAENNPNAGNDQAKMAMAFIDKTEGFSAAITIQKNIDVQLGLNTKDAEKAQEFAGVVSAGLIVGKAKVADLAKQNEKLAPAMDVMNSIKINTKGTNLVITGTVTFETLTKLLENLPMP